MGILCPCSTHRPLATDHWVRRRYEIHMTARTPHIWAEHQQVLGLPMDGVPIRDVDRQW